MGYIGKIHLRSSLKVANANLIAVSDISKKSLNESKKHGVKKTYTDYNQMLKDPEIDAVIIALPTHLHLACAELSAEAGKHIFLEKPMAPSANSAKAILSAVQRNDVRLMMGYPLRFNPVMMSLRKQLCSGELGDVVSAYAVNIGSGPFMHRAQGHAPVPVPDWWFNSKLTGGGVLIDLGSHMINLLRWYFGEVSCANGYLGYRHNLEIEDHAIGMIQFASGTSAVINVGWTSQDYKLKVELNGTVRNSIGENTRPKRLLAAAQMLLTNSSPFWQPFLSEIQYFVDCLANEKQPSPSGVDGLKDVQAIELIYRNSQKLEHSIKTA